MQLDPVRSAFFIATAHRSLNKALNHGRTINLDIEL